MKKNYRNQRGRTNKNSRTLLFGLLDQRVFRCKWMKAVSVLASLVVFLTAYMLILPAATITSDNASEGGGFYLDADAGSGNTGNGGQDSSDDAGSQGQDSPGGAGSEGQDSPDGTDDGDGGQDTPDNDDGGEGQDDSGDADTGNDETGSTGDETGNTSGSSDSSENQDTDGSDHQDSGNGDAETERESVVIILTDTEPGQSDSAMTGNQTENADTENSDTVLDGGDIVSATAAPSKAGSGAGGLIEKTESSETEKPEKEEEKEKEEIKVGPGPVQITEGTLEWKDGETLVRVSFDKEARIPEGSALEVTPLEKGTEEYRAYYRRALTAGYRENVELTEEEIQSKVASAMAGYEEELSGGKAMTSQAKIYDIKIRDAEGNEIEPEDEVDVEISFINGMTVRNDAEMKLVHFEEEAKRAEPAETEAGGDSRVILLFKEAAKYLGLFEGKEETESTSETGRIKAEVIPAATPSDLRAAQVLSDKDLTEEADEDYISRAEILSATEVSSEENSEGTEYKEVQTVSFSTESLSVYALTYTVDFHWEVNGKMYEFTLPGGGFVSFSRLVEVLRIIDQDETDDSVSTAFTLDDVEISDVTRKFVTDVESVVFSNPELVDISKVENETTVGGIKESRDLEVQYSADLTEEQIAGINSTVVESGDWALISMLPFDTEETITVTMKTGEVCKIRVTDAQIQKTVISASGEAYRITVDYDETAGIPDGAELEVTEILPGNTAEQEGDPENTDPESEEAAEETGTLSYEEYTEMTFEALGLDTGSFSYARFFNIKIVDENGEKVEIAAPVDVKIELTDKESWEESEDTTQVVHFADGSDSGDVIKITTEAAEAGQVVSFEAEGFSVYAIVTPTAVDDLNGEEFALITWNGGQTGKGLTGDMHQDIDGNLCAEFLTVMTKMNGKNQLQLFVPNNSNEQVTTWTFEQILNDIFKLKAKIYSRGDDGRQVYAGEKYLNIDSDGKLSMVDDESDASEIQVNLQTSGIHKGQICLKCNGKTLTYSGEFAIGFNTSGTTGNEWLYLAETKPESELAGYKRTYTAEKISVSDPSLTPLFNGDMKKVIIYTRVWNGSGYTYFAINGNGELVQCHESGNEIEWMGSGLDELQWKFTEYGNWTTIYQKDQSGELVLDGDGNPIPELLVDGNGSPVYETDAQGNYVLDDNGSKIQKIKQVITPNYYYELQNAYTGQYLAPLVSADQILSSSTIGLNMIGRRNGQYYTPILAWDGGNYSFTSIEADLDASASAGAVIHPCARVDGMDLYFAIVNDLEADDDIHQVPTVDNNMYGITMRMADYHTYIKGSNCDTSKEQHDILGSSEYTPDQTSGLLSTNLDSDGYPIATYSNKSLGLLFTATGDGKITVNDNVNHLFVESTYKATGYYEYDSSQNYAYLQSNGDFRVYQELGTHDYGKEKPTLKHGQFLPYHDIEPGHFAVKNGRNLYTPTGASLDSGDPRYNEQLYLADYEGEHPDFCFGTELTAGFYQTPSGLDAWGHDIIFEFSGDDDFWLYVDGELVIDLGGIHSALPASVNFRTGEVKVNGAAKSLRQVFIDNYTARGETEETAIKKADGDPDDPDHYPGIFVTKFDEELGRNVTTFKDNGYHEMRIFYMERGWSASNLHMKFNLAAVEKGTVQLSKELDVGDEDMSESVLAAFPYQVWYKDPLYNPQSTDHNTEYVQLTEETLGNRGSVKYLGSTNEVTYKKEIYVDNSYKNENNQAVQCSVKYEGVYLMNPGETVVITFPIFGETGEEQFVTEYKIVECGVDPNIYPNVTLDDGTVLVPKPVSTSIRVTQRDPSTGLPTAAGIGRPTVNGIETNDEVYSGLCNYEINYDSPDNRSKVKYKNKMEETEELLIQKNLYKKEGSAEPVLIPKSEYYDNDGNPLDPDNPDLKTTYDFRVSFKTPYDEDYTPANVYQYHVKDAGGYYCKWHPADTSSSNPNEEGSQGYFERITNENYPNGVKDYNLLTPDTFVNGHVVHGEQFAATFDTSINGAISQIPAYYTVELQGLIPGTQFKVIERTNETPDGYEFYRYELDGTPVEVDPWAGVAGSIVKDKKSEVLVDNYKGYALRLYKTWADASTMADRDPAYFAVYYETKNQDGDIVSSTLVADSVRRLEYKDDPQGLYWFYMHLPPVTDVTDPAFENYVVREVSLTGDGITVNDEGAVIGYETIDVVGNGGNVTIRGLSNSQGAEWKDIAYKVTYTKTQTVGTSLREFWIADKPSEKPAVKFLKEDWSGNPLADAEFTLKQGTTSIFENKNSTIADGDSQALISIEHLTENVDYVLKENLAPQGYCGLRENLTIRLVTDPSSNGIGWTLNVTPDTGDIKDYYDVGSEQVTETIDGQEVVTMYVTLTIKDRPYDFVVIKEDAITHNKLNGVTFTLHRQSTVGDQTEFGPAIAWDGNSELATSTIGGINGVIPHIDNQLPAGTYQLRETKAVSGYQLLTDNIDFTIGSTGVIALGNNHPADVTLSMTTDEDENVVYTLTIPNTPLPLKLVKKDISGADLLGAKFKLYQKNNSTFDVVERYKDIDLTETNSISLSDLPPNIIYWLEEVGHPEGYIITQKDIYFKIQNDRTVKLCDRDGNNITVDSNSVVQLSGNKTKGYTITVKNTPGAALPRTGGPGTKIFTILGSLMIMFAGVLMVKARKPF